MILDKKLYNILVVEDDLDDFTVVEDLIAEYILSPVIVNVENFRQAVALLSAGRTVFDVILLDISLPDKSGKELVAGMLQASGLCPVIVLTGYTDIDFSVRSISLGITDYLLKDDLSAEILYKSIIYSIERKKATAQLSESEKRYSGLFHLSPQPMWVYDLETLRFLDVNTAAINHYGYSREEFFTLAVSEIVPRESLHEMEKIVLDLRQHDPFFSTAILRHKKKNGEIFHAEIHSNTMLLYGKKARQVLVNDVTERIKYIAAIEKQNEKLREIAWMQSHVVRAPLARMMGIMDLIKELKTAPPEIQMLLDGLAGSSVELDAIIKDIVKKTYLIDVA